MKEPRPYLKGQGHTCSIEQHTYLKGQGHTCSFSVYIHASSSLELNQQQTCRYLDEKKHSGAKKSFYYSPVSQILKFSLPENAKINIRKYVGCRRPVCLPSRQFFIRIGQVWALNTSHDKYQILRSFSNRSKPSSGFQIFKYGRLMFCSFLCRGTLKI